MSCDEDLRAIFGEKVGTFRPEGRRLLTRLWESGRRQGRRECAGHFDQGRQAGLSELSILFTEVLRGRPLNELLREATVEPAAGKIDFLLQPWVLEVLQDVLNAPDLGAARRVAEGAGERELAIDCIEDVQRSTRSWWR